MSVFETQCNGNNTWNVCGFSAPRSDIGMAGSWRTNEKRRIWSVNTESDERICVFLCIFQENIYVYVCVLRMFDKHDIYFFLGSAFPQLGGLSLPSTFLTPRPLYQAPYFHCDPTRRPSSPCSAPDSSRSHTQGSSVTSTHETSRHSKIGCTRQIRAHKKQQRAKICLEVMAHLFNLATVLVVIGHVATTSSLIGCNKGHHILYNLCV